MLHVTVIIPDYIASALSTVDCLGFENARKALGACILHPDYDSRWDLSGMSPVDLACLRYFIEQESAGRRIDSVTVTA